VELITHNPKGTIIDVYTTRDWSGLCDAVLCLSFDAPFDVGSNGTGNPSSSAWTRSSRTRRVSWRKIRETTGKTGRRGPYKFLEKTARRSVL
jgi:hypothetical protein